MRGPQAPGAQPPLRNRSLSVPEAARALHLSPKAVSKRVQDGRLPAARLGRMYRIPERTVLAYQEA